MKAFATMRRHALGFASALLLAACGGGGTDPLGLDGGSRTSQRQAEAASVNSAVMPTEGLAGMSAALSLAHGIVFIGQASQTVPCPAGGSATFTVSGLVPALLVNQRFDTDEHYAIAFNQCRDIDGTLTTGSLTLDVRNAAGNDYTVFAATQNLAVTTPRRTLSLNGSSTLTHTEATAGGTLTVTERWVAPQYVLVSSSASRSSSFTLRNVDMTRTVRSVNGVVVGSTTNGTATLSADLPDFDFTVTLATDGDVNYSADGLPLSGRWSIRLPRDEINFRVVAGVATLSLDLGANGSTDAVYLLTVLQLVAMAG